MSKGKICKHPKKFRKTINAGWNNVNIDFGGTDQDLAAWCSNCGAIEVWKNMEGTHWLKPKLVEDRLGKL